MDVVPINPKCTLALTMNFWVTRAAMGIDLDGVAFLVGNDGLCAGDADLIFYGNEGDKSSVWHYGDSPRRRRIPGERLYAKPQGIAPRVQRVVFAVSIYPHALHAAYHMGMVGHLELNVVRYPGKGVKRSFTSEVFGTGRSVILCELRRDTPNWQLDFSPQPVDGGLDALCHRFGLNVEFNNHPDLERLR
jgi:tellurium resistance protein TerD